MSKKFDIKRTLGNPAPPLSIEAVEEMTQLIHNKKTADNAARNTDDSSVPQSRNTDDSSVPQSRNTDESSVQRQPIPKVEKIIEEPEKGKRGRKPNPIIETERQLRVSVDLPETTFIQLKILVIQQKTDMKSYIRKLVEKDLAKK
jgi:hypothetical protein